MLIVGYKNVEKQQNAAHTAIFQLKIWNKTNYSSEFGFESVLVVFKMDFANYAWSLHYELPGAKFYNPKAENRTF